MLERDARLSLADLSAAGVRLRPVDAVTIVREVIAQVIRGEIPGVPSAHVIRILPSGSLTIEGPVVAGDRGVSRAAQLLDTLLPGFDAPPEYRVPGALRLVVARALGTLDVPPHPSLESLAEALGRFVASDPQALLRDLAATRVAQERSDAPSAEPVPAAAARQDSSQAPTADAPRPDDGVPDVRRQEPRSTGPDGVSISDIRRSRRATGLPLQQIAARSRIPVSLLRQLEWGYLRNWPIGPAGRTQLVRYARAAGLDEQLVVSTVFPMIEEVARDRALPIEPVAAEPVPPDTPGPRELGDLTLILPVRPAHTARRRAGMLAALGVAALVAISVAPRVGDDLPGLLPGWLPGSLPRWLPGSFEQRPQPHAKEQAANTPEATRPQPRPAEPPARVPQPAARTTTPAASVPASNPRSAPGGALGDAPVNARSAQALADEGVSYSPAFASTGTAMFYHAKTAKSSALLRADTDEEGAVLRITRVVDDKAQNFHPRPSPDGTRIAFDSDREGVRGIYIANADGTDVRRVSGPGFAAVPSWSPDGGRLVYVRAETDRPRVWNLWLLDLATSEERRLTSYKVGQPWGGSWFPDGRRIAYSHEDRLIVLDTVNGRQRVYPSPREGRLVRTPAVSPDGRRVIFQVYRDGAWLLHVADGSMQRVLADPSAEEYTWSPDGRRVAYHSRRSGGWGVWIMASR